MADDNLDTAILFFAWVEEGTAWSEDLARIDEQIFAFSIVHQENECATLDLDLVNPKVGLLAAGRNLWAWLTHRKPNGDLIPLFFGRLLGIPDEIQDEVVRLQFRAKPVDYDEQQAAIAASLRELPWYDPVFMAEGAELDPVNSIETRNVAWHCDRITHEVTVSDIGQGEDGTITITAADGYVDGVKVDVGQAPLTRVSVEAAVTWTQKGAGVVDLTQVIYDAFAGTGMPYQYPIVGSFTSDGLLGDWPKPGSSIGAGWSVHESSIAEIPAWQRPASKKVKYVEKPVEVPTVYQITTTPAKIGQLPKPTIFGEWEKRRQQNLQGLGGLTGPKPGIFVTPAEEAALGWKNWDVLFEIGPILQNTKAFYQTSRGRTERVSFTLTGGLQPLLTDPEGTDVLNIALSSSALASPIDAGGGWPLYAESSNSYFPTERGQLSLQYLMLLARSHMYVRARGISITVEPRWETVVDSLSCRMNMVVHDPRFPGGQVAGKVIGYTLAHDAAGKPLHASVTIGCMVGTGEVLDDIPPPANSYIDDYIDNQFENEPGGAVPVIPGELRYQAFDGLYVIDDDGLDLLNMTPSNVVQSIVITNGVTEQEQAIKNNKAAPVDGLEAVPTKVTLTLVPLTGQSFETDYLVEVEPLTLPKTVDLAAEPL